MSFYPINYQEPSCPLAQLISDPAVTFCSYLMSGGVRWDGNMAVSHWLPTGYLRRGARAGIREKEDSVLGKPRCNYTDPRKASHTYREGHIENYWKRRRGLSVHGNTPGFLLSLFIYFECIQREQNGVVIIHRPQEADARCYKLFGKTPFTSSDHCFKLACVGGNKRGI